MGNADDSALFETPPPQCLVLIFTFLHTVSRRVIDASCHGDPAILGHRMTSSDRRLPCPRTSRLIRSE